MPGSHYIALSGLRTRVDALDRLASDLANVGTTGYKGERDTTASAERPDLRPIAAERDRYDAGRPPGGHVQWRVCADGRPLDVAIDGEGFFVIDTPNGTRYTRNGHFSLDADRKLVTEDGLTVQGNDGPDHRRRR
jgi:flagellar basal-body rod protein FlgG